LNEKLGIQELLGCAIMLVGMLLSQLQNIKSLQSSKKS